MKIFLDSIGTVFGNIPKNEQNEDDPNFPSSIQTGIQTFLTVLGRKILILPRMREHLESLRVIILYAIEKNWRGNLLVESY